MSITTGCWSAPRDHHHTRQAVDDRINALEAVGAKLFVERLRLE